MVMMADLSKKRLIHINADGTLDRSFHQPQLDGFIKSISPFGEDKILVGGDFLTTESGDRFLTCVINKDGRLMNHIIHAKTFLLKIMKQKVLLFLVQNLWAIMLL